MSKMKALNITDGTYEKNYVFVVHITTIFDLLIYYSNFGNVKVYDINSPHFLLVVLVKEEKNIRNDKKTHCARLMKDN